MADKKIRWGVRWDAYLSDDQQHFMDFPIERIQMKVDGEWRFLEPHSTQVSHLTAEEFFQSVYVIKALWAGDIAEQTTTNARLPITTDSAHSITRNFIRRYAHAVLGDLISGIRNAPQKRSVPKETSVVNTAWSLERFIENLNAYVKQYGALPRASDKKESKNPKRSADADQLLTQMNRFSGGRSWFFVAYLDEESREILIRNSKLHPEWSTTPAHQQILVSLSKLEPSHPQFNHALASYICVTQREGCIDTEKLLTRLLSGLPFISSLGAQGPDTSCIFALVQRLYSISK